MIKKTLLAYMALLMLPLCVCAQTHFSQLLGNSLTLHSGFASARMADSSFVTVGINPSGRFRLTRLDVAGHIINTRDVFSASTITITHISTATESGPNEILVTGKCDESSMDFFFVAKINVSTGATVAALESIDVMAFAQGPKISKANNSLYVAYPQFTYFDIHKYTYSTMGHVWSKSIRCDTVDNKNPSTGCAMSDSGIVLLGKCDSIPGWCGLDTSGAIDTFKLFYMNGYTRLYDIERFSDGNYVMAGFHSPAESSSLKVPTIIKVTPSGTVLWSVLLDETSPSDTLTRFVQVKEMPDGRIAAFASVWDSFDNTFFNGVCFFDLNGNLLSSHQLGSFIGSPTSNLFYQLYDVEVYTDGFLMSGIAINTSTLTAQNLVIFTAHDFSDVCYTGPLNPVVTNLPTGPVMNYGTDHVQEQVSPGILSAFTAGSAVVTNPVPDFMCSITLDITEPLTGSQDVTVYPNPAHEQINIVFNTGGAHTFTFFDVYGHVVHSETTSLGQVQLSTSLFAPGMYILRTAGKKNAWLKVVVT